MAFEWAACARGDYGHIVVGIHCTNLYSLTFRVKLQYSLVTSPQPMEHVSMYDLIVWLHAIFDLGIVAARDSLMPSLPPSLLLFSLRLTNMALRMQMEPQCGRVPPSAHVASLAWHAFDHKQRAFLQLYKLANQVITVISWYVTLYYAFFRVTQIDGKNVLGMENHLHNY